MSEARPNILFITSDQQHWNTLGITNPEIQTPHLDQLAAEGTVFTNAFCANPTCTPTRASIITGKYPSQHGAWALGTKLPEREQTLGDLLGNGGYRTGLIGKAHFQPLKTTSEYESIEAFPVLHDFDFWQRFTGPFYGFEHIEISRGHTDENGVAAHYILWLEENGCTNWRDYFRPPVGKNETQKHRWLIPEKYHYSKWIAERTDALLEEYARKGERFCLWASFFDPHPDYLVPEPWDTMYDPAQLTVPSVVEGEHDNNPPHFQLTQEPNPDFSAWKEPEGNYLHGLHTHVHDRGELAKDIAIYYAMTSLMDKYIGEILARLEQLGLAENTLVVFTTDHGHFYGQHGLIAKGPFHYQDMIRVPFIARLPGRIPAGRQSDAMLSHVDLAPTFLRFANLDVPRTMTGLDQTDVWLGRKEKARDHVIVENHHQPTTVHLKTYVGERYKITVYYNRDYGELFDLRDDPGEVRNLWNSPEHAKLKAELLLKMLHAELGKEPMWMPRIAVA
jgi:arylsulfatase A-like enzyme